MPAIINTKGDVEATCECGKELCMMDMYGMFCEDLCGHNEAVVAHEGIEKLIDDAVGIIDFFENMKVEE